MPRKPSMKELPFTPSIPTLLFAMDQHLTLRRLFLTVTLLAAGLGCFRSAFVFDLEYEEHFLWMIMSLAGVIFFAASFGAPLGRSLRFGLICLAVLAAILATVAVLIVVQKTIIHPHG